MEQTYCNCNLLLDVKHGNLTSKSVKTLGFKVKEGSMPNIGWL